MPVKQLVIVGAGGFGREVLSWARDTTDSLPIKGFLDDRSDALDGFAKDVGVIGSISHHRPSEDELYVCAMGNVEFKRRCILLLKERGAVFGRLVHRTAVVGDSAELGEGVILCPFVVIGADARLADFVTVNYHSTVAHDARVGRFSQLHCHVDVTGNVEIGERVTLGSHSSVLPGVKVGDDVTVGSGSIVMGDVNSGLTVFGSPARPLVKREVIHA
jgi:sugar O-acyltransferase (sialic acid O-acetyltransferase NeuD family)